MVNDTPCICIKYRYFHSSAIAVVIARNSRLIDIARIRVDIARRKHVEFQLIGSIVVGVVVEFSYEKCLVLDSANDLVDALRDSQM